MLIDVPQIVPRGDGSLLYTLSEPQIDNSAGVSDNLAETP